MNEVLKYEFPCRADQFQLVSSLTFTRFGFADPTCRVAGCLFAKAFWTPEGSCLLALNQELQSIRAEILGDGALWVRNWLQRNWPPRPLRLPACDAAYHSRVEKLLQRFRGIAVAPVPWSWDVAMAYVFQQRVTFGEASDSFAKLVHRYGPTAPGPLSLQLIPHPRDWAQIGADRLQQIGLDAKRARTSLRLARLGVDPSKEKLQALRGIGPWTLSMWEGLALGNPDAVPTGDVHLPHTVCGYLIDQPWHGDSKMLELLEPYFGVRFWVLSLLMRAGR